MYINRIDRPLVEPSRRAIAKRKNSGESFQDTMTSIIEVDVVEVGDSTEDHKRDNRNPFADRQKKSLEGEKSGLDIKV